MCSFLLRSVGGGVGGWAVMEAEPAHTDYTGKRNNVSGSNRQYLDPNGSLHVGPHFCLHVWDTEQYPGEMIRSYRKAPLLIFTWFSVVVICKEPIGAWGSDHLITTLWVWLSTEVSMCVFAQVHVCVCVCVCVWDMSSHAKAAGKKVWVLLIKQRWANLARTLPESACFY